MTWFRYGMVLLACLAGAVAAQEQVTVYSARSEPLIKPLLDRFSRATGIEVRLMAGSEAALLSRLVAEKEHTPADLLLTVDAGNLWQAAQLGLLAPAQMPEIDALVPAHLRDEQTRWFALSLRVRSIAYNTATVKAESLSSYQDLATAKWRGKLCLRSSKKVYNQSLVAMLMVQHGEAGAEKIVRGWVSNLAAPVFSDDTALIKAIAHGTCQVGLVNSYYLARLLAKEPQLPVAMAWANQQQGGVHVNVSGIGLVKHAKNPSAAKQLMAFLISNEAQQFYADQDFEYPVRRGMAPNSLIKAWGNFNPSTTPVSRYGQLQESAIRLMDRAGYR